VRWLGRCVSNCLAVCWPGARCVGVCWLGFRCVGQVVSCVGQVRERSSHLRKRKKQQGFPLAVLVTRAKGYPSAKPSSSEDSSTSTSSSSSTCSTLLYLA
jgi:hypothetical protein